MKHRCGEPLFCTQVCVRSELPRDSAALGALGVAIAWQGLCYQSPGNPRWSQAQEPLCPGGEHSDSSYGMSLVYPPLQPPQKPPVLLRGWSFGRGGLLRRQRRLSLMSAHPGTVQQPQAHSCLEPGSLSSILTLLLNQHSIKMQSDQLIAT